MSRRKQSNPKPIKRSDEGDDGEMSKELQTSEDSMDQSNASSPDAEEAEDDAMETQTKGEVDGATDTARETTHEATQDSATGETTSEETRLFFPHDLLKLTKVEDSELVQTGIPWVVSAGIALQKGSSIGPYLGELVALSSIKPGELVLQFQGPSGEFAFIKVLEEAGAWLSLLKPSDGSSTHNTNVYFEGGRIWCEVVTDLDVGTELVASFTVSGEPPSSSPGSEELPSPKSKVEVEKSEDKKSVKPEVKSPRMSPERKSEPRPAPPLQPQHAALKYGCPFCTVRFSSLRTLDAHLTHYCSKKPPDLVNLQDLQNRIQQQQQLQHEQQKFMQSGGENISVKKEEEDGAVEVSQTEKIGPEESVGLKRLHEAMSPGSSGSPSDNEGPPSKSPKTGFNFKCSSCSYSADKLSSLNRHRRIHNRTGDGDCSDKLSVAPVAQSETFCKDCNIQFSSISTYRGHKEFYCQGRNANKSDDGEADPSPEPKSPAIQDLSPQSQLNILTASRLAAASNQILVNMSLLSAAGLGPKLNMSGNVPVVLPGVNTTSPGLKSPQQGLSPGKMTSTVNDVSSPALDLKIKTDSTVKRREEELPLDLTTSRSSDNLAEITVKKEQHSPSASANEVDETIEPKDFSIKKEPESPKNIPASESPSKLSPKTSEMHDVTSLLKKATPLNIPAIIPSLMMSGSQAHYVPSSQKKPISPLQSVSRCVECNIVFYKHENYLIHKEHYCSGRRPKGSPHSSDTSTSDNSDDKHDHTAVKTASNLAQPRSAASQIKPIEAVLKSPHLESSKRTNSPPKPREICYRFYCIPCKIKFSSAGTLKAHKEFYCPHGQNTDQTLVVKEPLEKEVEPRSNSSDVTYRCENCGSEFLSSRLLKLHFCTGSSSQMPLLRCPYCDYVTQTENRLSEHMKVHIPTKAYKCTICGYRGNTSRGMRMHGKMHIDNGEEFTDENMIEYEEPPQVPVQISNGICAKGPVDVETELIRLKNEPYKRRRSRKSFEKSENFSSLLSQAMLPHVCAACGQSFTDVNSFVIHLRMHEMAALEAMKNLKCEHCRYIADSLNSLLSHMHTKHPDQLPGTSRRSDVAANSEEERSKSCNSETSSKSDEPKSSAGSKSPDSFLNPNQENSGIKVENGHRESYSPKRSPEHQRSIQVNSESLNGVQVKEELPENSYTEQRSENVLDLKNTQENTSQGSSITNEQLSQKERKRSSSDIHSPKEKESFKNSDLKSEPSSPKEKELNYSIKAEPLSPKVLNISSCSTKLSRDYSEAHIKQESRSPILKGNTCSPKSRPTSSPTTPTISPKPLSPTAVISPSKLQFPLYNPALFPYFQLASGLQGFPHPSMVSHPSEVQSSSQVSPTSTRRADNSQTNYCKHCDINFKYLATFQTHKKYYCCARQGSGELSPSASA